VQAGASISARNRPFRTSSFFCPLCHLFQGKDHSLFKAFFRVIASGSAARALKSPADRHQYHHSPRVAQLSGGTGPPRHRCKGGNTSPAERLDSPKNRCPCRDSFKRCIGHLPPCFYRSRQGGHRAVFLKLGGSTAEWLRRGICQRIGSFRSPKRPCRPGTPGGTGDFREKGGKT